MTPNTALSQGISSPPSIIPEQEQPHRPQTEGEEEKRAERDERQQEHKNKKDDRPGPKGTTSTQKKACMHVHKNPTYTQHTPQRAATYASTNISPPSDVHRTKTLSKISSLIYAATFSQPICRRSCRRHNPFQSYKAEPRRKCI